MTRIANDNTRHRSCGRDIHERTNEVVASIYPEGMHATIAGALSVDTDISVSWATLEQPEHGLPAERHPGSIGMA